MEQPHRFPVPADRPAGPRRHRLAARRLDGALRAGAIASTTGATTSTSSAARSPRSSGADKAKTVPSGLQQIWVPALGRADRCITCHQAVRWKGFEIGRGAVPHPPEGAAQGRIRSRSSAAPRATAARAGRSTRIRRTARSSTGRSRCWARRSARPTRSSTNKSALMQMNCNVCHRYDRETKGADVINLAKKLVTRQGLPRLPRDQRPRRHDRPRPDVRRRQGARAVRLRPPVGPEDGVRLARRAPQGPARARARHGDAELPPHAPRRRRRSRCWSCRGAESPVPAAYRAGRAAHRSADAGGE